MGRQVITSIALGMLVWLSGTAVALSAVTGVPTGLELTISSREAYPDHSVTLTVSLHNYRDQRVIAAQPVRVIITANLPFRVVKRSLPLLIRSGSDSNTADVVFERPGVVKLEATAPGLAPAHAVLAVKPVAKRSHVPTLSGLLTDAVEQFYPMAVAAEVPTTAADLQSRCTPAETTATPHGLWLAMLPPRVPERNGRWTAKLVVGLVNNRGEPIEAVHDTAVHIEPTIGTVTNEQIVVTKGDSTAEARITSSSSGCDRVYAWSMAAGGVPNVQVEYEQPRPAKVSVIPMSPRAVANGWATVAIAIVLRDEDDHVVRNPAHDLRVVLSSSLGTLSSAAVTVSQGRPDSDEVLLSSRQRGLATVTAAAEGLGSDAQTVSFVLPFLLIPMAAGGGIAGTLLRIRRGRRRADYRRDLLTGSLFGFVFFGLILFGVPTIVPTAASRTLENLTLNELGAFLLGLLGGYWGRHSLDWLTISGKARARVAA
jgi:hypothetical protein